jgi:hypothetical protein
MGVFPGPDQGKTGDYENITSDTLQYRGEEGIVSWVIDFYYHQ